MKRQLLQVTLLAGLTGMAGLASAQTTAVPAPPDPVAGQASTRSLSGEPNPTQRPDASMPASREAVRSDARVSNRNSANTLVPNGEASTMVNGQPNQLPQPSGAVSRQEVRYAALKRAPRFGERGEQLEVPTNPGDGTGTPK